MRAPGDRLCVPGLSLPALRAANRRGTVHAWTSRSVHRVVPGGAVRRVSAARVSSSRHCFIASPRHSVIAASLPRVNSSCGIGRTIGGRPGTAGKPFPSIQTILSKLATRPSEPARRGGGSDPS